MLWGPNSLRDTRVLNMFQFEGERQEIQYLRQYGLICENSPFIYDRKTGKIRCLYDFPLIPILALINVNTTRNCYKYETPQMKALMNIRRQESK